MKTRNLTKNKIYMFLDYVFRLVMINFLIILPSFSFLLIYSFLNETANNLYLYLTFIPMILYFYPAIVAGLDVIRKYQVDGSTGIFKEFFVSLKKHYWQSLLYSIIIAIFFILLLNSVNYFYQQITLGIGYLIGLMVSISIIAIFLFLIIHLPLTSIYFDGLTVKDRLQLTLMMAFKDFFKTLLLVFILICLIILNVIFVYFFLIIGVSLYLYLMIIISFKQYIKITRKIEK